MKKSKLKKYNVHYIVSCMRMLTESLMFQRATNVGRQVRLYTGRGVEFNPFISE